MPNAIAGRATRSGSASSRARGTVVAIQDADLELDPAQLALLVDPIVRGSSSVVYGSRFLGGRPNAPWLSIAANRALTSLTNAVYGSSLTDMETCYKIMRSDVARSLELTADRFDIEPEITARLLRAGHRIVERPGDVHAAIARRRQEDRLARRRRRRPGAPAASSRGARS